MAVSNRTQKFLLGISAWVFWTLTYVAVGRWAAADRRVFLPDDFVWKFPFIHAFVVPYVTAYIMPLVAFAAIKDIRRLRKLVTVLVGLTLSCAAIYVILPIGMNRPVVQGHGLFEWGMRVLYMTDPPTNLFPSTHVSMSLLFAKVTAHERPRWTIPLLGWSALIAVSTLFIHQHYLADVVAGLLAGAAAWRIYLALIRENRE